LDFYNIVRKDHNPRILDSGSAYHLKFLENMQSIAAQTLLHHDCAGATKPSLKYVWLFLACQIDNDFCGRGLEKLGDY